MFRLKNESELENSFDDACQIAGCEEVSEKIYANSETNIIDICMYHYEKLSTMRYGE